MDELLPHYEVALRRLADATRFVVQYSALAQRLASRYPAPVLLACSRGLRATELKGCP